MDANKLNVLQNINYTVRKTCGNCQHAVFQGNNDFGNCVAQQYEHLKHSEKSRYLSIHESGFCDKHEWQVVFAQLIHGFAQLMEK